MKFLSSMITMTTTVNFIITTTFLATTTTYSTTISAAAATTTTVSNDQLPLLLSSSSSFNNLRHYHRGRFLDDEEENGNIDNNDNGGPDEDSIVKGSCLFVTDHPNDTTPYNNNNSLSSCTEFYGDADGDGDVWDYDKMVNYCSHKYNSTLTIKEECPSNYSLSSELEIIIGWCHVEEVIEGNITLIQVTPMVTIASPTNNCSDNQRECESVMGGIFKTTSECTATSATTSISDSDINATTIDDIDDGGDSQDQEVLAGYDVGCDESKCVSNGLGWVFDDSFTCYTDNADYPMMCSNGYQPQIVENEPTLIFGYNDNIFHYFTCCPPKLLFDANISVRHCSNTTTFPDFNNTMICEDDNRPYPRQMKNYTDYWSDELVESYICCDSITNNYGNQTTNFLNITECVPYQNKNYDKMRIFDTNYYGEIYPMVCNYPNFQYANENGECCRTNQGTKYFIQDTAFKATVYPQIFLSTIAVISCTILIVALLIPLWLHWRVQSAAANVPVNITRAANTRLQQAAAASTYSSHNLYLVFLAIPDFLLNLYLLIMYGSYANQKYNPNFSGVIIYTEFDDGGIDYTNEGSFILACSTANLYLNCVVSYEMRILLRNNNQVIRHNPPSLLRVTFQAIGVYLFSIIVFTIHYFIERSDIYDKEFINLIWSVVVTYIFPIGFFFYIWITIKCHNYMPSVTESTKQLVWFFRRIVFVFCLLWFPGMFCVVIGTALDGPIVQVGLLFCGLQPTVSTCMAMTKADVRKHTLNVVRLSFISTSKSTSVSYIRTSLSRRASHIRSSLSSRASYIRTLLSSRAE